MLNIIDAAPRPHPNPVTIKDSNQYVPTFIFPIQTLNRDVWLFPLMILQVGKKFLDEERMKKKIDDKTIPFEHNLEFLVDPFFRKTT